MLFSEAERAIDPPVYLDSEPWRPIRVLEESLQTSFEQGTPIGLDLLGGSSIVVESWRRITNPSGSQSWVGKVQGDENGVVVLVSRAGVVIGSIRAQGSLFILSYLGASEPGVHLLYKVDESSPKYQESPPTPIHLAPSKVEQEAPGQSEEWSGGEDDGSIQDLMVVYTPRAVSEVGGTVAMENLIDLGVTETNLSYEASGVHHRLRLVHTAPTDYDELSAGGDPRDQLQDPDDGFMDEVHAVRDQVRADLVKLIISTGTGAGCGRAFIMDEVSIAFEAFAFCYTNHICVSPGYTFQHELGHIQSGRHQRTGPVTGSPFPFNHGYTDPTNQFRTIMAAGSSECPNGCPRRLAWSNPDVNDPATGAPMGIPEGNPEAADNRKTLNATAWTVANFRVSNSTIFADGFESGDTGAWTTTVN